MDERVFGIDRIISYIYR